MIIRCLYGLNCYVLVVVMNNAQRSYENKVIILIQNISQIVLYGVLFPTEMLPSWGAV